jgi:2-polyprenyl-3-methyl-5-hydroxy-6-metoxy-1,4-benzoquinol methylase
MNKNLNNQQFDFGQNWKNFSEKKLNKDRINQAKEDFTELVKDLNIIDKTFIDIGFGQGLGLLSSVVFGAKSVGVDINEKCNETLERNRDYFPELKNINIPVIIGSILDESTLEKIKSKHKTYDIVHSWGVLHHTGKMWTAIDNCCQLINQDGIFILAIYNKHWSSRLWYFIKKIYNSSPAIIKRLMIYKFYAIIYIAKFLVTFKNPLKKERGMSFYYDIVDWIGGFPYEYATKNEIVDFMKSKGLCLIKYRKAEVPTGCNEFVFKKQ